MSGKVITKPFPLTIPTFNIGIAPITVNAASAHGIFFEVKAFRVWHPIDDFSQRSDFRTPRTHQTADSLTSLCCHNLRLGEGTDKKLILFVLQMNYLWGMRFPAISLRPGKYWL